DDDLAVAEQLMAQCQVSRLLITDENGSLKGIVSLSDVAEREPTRRSGAPLRAVAARAAPHPQTTASASISAPAFGTPAARLSRPVSVTTMSSSMRTPSPRYSSGAWASSGT